MKPITEVDRLNRHVPGHWPPWSPSRHLNGTECQWTRGFALGRLHVFLEKKITEVAPLLLKKTLRRSSRGGLWKTSEFATVVEIDYGGRPAAGVVFGTRRS